MSEINSYSLWVNYFYESIYCMLIAAFEIVKTKKTSGKAGGLNFIWFTRNVI
jgi:hypothetical protein